MRFGRGTICGPSGVIGLLGAVLAGGSAGAQSAGFCDTVRALTHEPAVAAAHWGVSVTAMDGTVLCNISQAQLFRPASNDKLFTLAAGLALLGPERRFTTSVVAEGDLTDGVLNGNLRLVGGGDANFGAHDVPYVPPAQRPKTPQAEPATIADIEELADQVMAKGLKSITGDVVGDDTYFSWQPYPTGWDIGDLLSSDGAPVSALTIHDSEEEFQVAPNLSGHGQAVLSMAPDVPYYTLDNRVVTQDLGQGCAERLKFRRDVGSRTMLVFGDIPARAAPCRRSFAIQDPAEYAAMALKQALERRGVTIAGTAVATHWDPLQLGNVFTAQHDPDDRLQAIFRRDLRPGPCEAQSVAGPVKPPRMTLATHVSPSLADDATATAKMSQNLHAEILLRNVGATYTCGRTERDSLHVVKEYLLFAGIPAADFILYDGSGLSGHDLVTPRAFTQLLVFAAKQKWFDTFKAALPIGGVDGTLANRFHAPDSTLAGRVFAKTGTLGESRALSGYIAAASGKTVTFSVMVDNHPPTGGADRAAMDKIVEAIAAGN